MILINGEEVGISKFPNGESKVEEDLYFDSTLSFTLKWESDEDFINLMFLKRYCDERVPATYKKLTILYMPYSRMDRKVNESIFTLKYLCDFINSLGFDSVIINEPHSDVTSALINNCVVHNTTHTLFIDSNLRPDYIFYPDAGAQKRYKIEVYKELVGFKERDLRTGRIKKYNVFGELKKGSSVVILDDLCSYGGTFELASKQLKEMGAGDIYLIVAHCEKSIISGNIFKSGNIKKVLTTNSIIDIKYQEQINEEFGEDKISIKDLMN